MPETRKWITSLRLKLGSESHYRKFYSGSSHEADGLRNKLFDRAGASLTVPLATTLKITKSPGAILDAIGAFAQRRSRPGTVAINPRRLTTLDSSLWTDCPTQTIGFDPDGYTSQLQACIQADFGDGVLPGKRDIRQLACRMYQQVERLLAKAYPASYCKVFAVNGYKFGGCETSNPNLIL